MIAPKVFTVGQINRYLKNLLEQDVILNSLLLQGEVSNFKAHTSGHWYFTLKDERGAISCVIFRQNAMQIPFLPKNGMQVLVYGAVSLYEKSGQYQLYGEFLEPMGMGALQTAFLQVKESLAAEGLFDTDFKRALPEQIACIALVTSPTGAAVRDIIQIAKRRDPRVKLVIFPTLVQGEQAAAEIARSIKAVNAWGKADVLIVGRGGGSLEDLWAFNEEIVARAIFASEIPVISAVGHETDFTIADFVADLRAPTPSAAAELATVPLRERQLALERWEHRMGQAVWNTLQRKKQRWCALAERPVLQRPLTIKQRKEHLLAETTRFLQKEVLLTLEKKQKQLLALEAQLAARFPLSFKKRGYAMVLDAQGMPLTSTADVTLEQEVRLVLHDGSFRARILEIERTEPENG